MVEFLIFVFVKYLSYGFVCAFAARSLKFRENDLLKFAITWGAARLLIGFIFGFLILTLYSKLEPFGQLISYIFSFGISRYIEWLILFYAMYRTKGLPFTVSSNVYIFSGITVSLLLDLIAWLFLEFGNANIKFFC